VNEFLGACQNAGLDVVATICDMDAKGVKPLKQLAATIQKPFFKFWNQDILTVYDPPHFLKCTRNLFLNCKVQFESELMCNQLPVIVKWEHILNAYKWDKQNIICPLYKPTDACLSPAAQYALKVSWAAQTMCHTVEASCISAASLGKEHCAPSIVLKKEVK